MSAPVVLVLAGGAANRFWPLRDKPLLEFGSQTLLARHLRALQAQGFSRFIVVCGPEAREKISAGLTLMGLSDARVAVQAEARGMADAVLCAHPELERLGECPVYITQAQDVVGADLHAAMLQGWSRRPEALFGLVAAVRVNHYFPGGYLSLAGERVDSIVEKPGAGNEPSDLVSLVAHVLASWRPFVERLAAEAPREGQDDALRQAQDDVYERALSSLMAAHEVRAVVHEGRWQAVKHPWHVLDVMEMLLDRWLSEAESPGDGYVPSEGGVFLGRDVKVYPGAHVVGPALIGHGSVIGHNALVRGSIVGPRCVVGFGSEVARSYLGEGVELHHNYVGDSVLDAGSSMGFGATTANFRLDGRSVPSVVGGQRVDSGREKLGLVLGAGAKIGVNSSTMPGVKIGAGAVCGPNLTIARDVPDGVRVMSGRRYGHL